MIIRTLLYTAMVSACLVMPGCGGGAGSSPGGVAKGFFQALADGDAQKAKTFMAPADASQPQADLAIGMMTTKLKAMTTEKKGIKSITVAKENVTGDTGTIDLKLEFGDGSSEVADGIEVKKVDGKWYVDMDDSE